MTGTHEPGKPVVERGNGTMTPTVGSLLADLEMKQDEVLGFVEALDRSRWTLPTTRGWTMCDQVEHLPFSDDVARRSITDPQAFAMGKREALVDVPASERAHLHAFPLDGEATVRAWATAGEGFRRAAGQADPGRRLQWFGPDMGLMGMISARLMETWAHGQDIADALAVTRTPAERLRHVAALAVRARPQCYAVRGMAVAQQEVRVELSLPEATFGPGDEPEPVRGPAEDFCLVLTRRRHVDDTATRCEGAAARERSEMRDRQKETC